jgi:hypothetical protein
VRKLRVAHAEAAQAARDTAALFNPTQQETA